MIGSQHGMVEISFENHIIIATLNGAFNEIGAEKYTEGVKSIVNKLKDEKYAILVDNCNMEGGTPEAYQVLEKYNQWLNTTNLVAKAIVVNSPITTNLIKSLSPSVKLQTTKSFNDKKSALKWLKEILSLGNNCKI